MPYFQSILHLFKNMGPRYVWFRAGYELKRRSGLLKKKFPTDVPPRTWATRQDWQQLPTCFFDFSPIKAGSLSWLLIAEMTEYRKGNLLFFGTQYYHITDWLINPDTGYRYDAAKHWTEIADFSPEAGDIKYVWEKSRFSFLYALLRYDWHARQDQSETVFGEIESWIAANPVNQGPNWRCSQEIALRVLNWTYALNYYKHSPALTEARFEKIVHSIYWQAKHIESNIDFSRIAVRNNHAITETLALYSIGLLYPFFKESTRWKNCGKRWFEQEIAYQIYDDGTFLQFSMNYHRVVVQLLTWGIELAHVNQERFADTVYDRAQKSLIFLRACQDLTTGWLPNYGNNDGALFFKFTDAHFRDYRPQLSHLSAVMAFLGASAPTTPSPIFSFKKSGYYLLRDADTLTFLRCGAYKDRPFQADNLHLDIWVNGQNILRDAGSYKYNTDAHWTRYFAGTASHNTVMLDSYDQMQKGPRFIWYHWAKKANGQWAKAHNDAPTTNIQQSTPQTPQVTDDWFFEGSVKVFGHLKPNIYHHRRVAKTTGQLHWRVEDRLEKAPSGLLMNQIWHPSPEFFDQFIIRAWDENDQELKFTKTEGWYSEIYSKKEPAQRIVFSTLGRYIRTEIISISAGL